jgi:lysophospholipase L1-like esterase
MKRLALVLVVASAVGLLMIRGVASGAPASKAAAAKAEQQKKVFAPITDDPKLPRVLLIGDSISMGYTLPVRKMLAGKANVHRVPENAGDTARGLANLDKWLGDKPWDVIHFNFGLHDLKRIRKGRLDSRGRQVRSPEEYGQNLETLVQRLKKTGATLIWATTTPVPAGAGGRMSGDEIRYNAVAAKIMKQQGVKVDDLYGHIKPKLAEAQLRKNVHYSAKGSEMLAEQVAKSIAAALAERTTTSRKP